MAAPEYKIKGSALSRAESRSAALDYGGAKNTTSTPRDSDSQKYRWFKAAAGDPYPPDTFYYVHGDTKESRWEEPEEPYWLWDPVLQAADPDVGLLQPAEKEPPKPYTGYNPKIHGNYDPNADYAQYHNKLHEEEDRAAAAPSARQPAYGASMILNARTGNAQAKGPGAEHHSDAAKSGRQMNAYFDADAAANAHGGQSLKEERQKQVHSKEKVKEWKQKTAERKRKKQMAFLMS